MPVLAGRLVTISIALYGKFAVFGCEKISESESARLSRFSNNWQINVRQAHV